MARYAIIQNGEVVNCVEWDGVSNWSPPEGCEAALHDEASREWSYDGKEFVRPIDIIDPELKPLLRTNPLLDFLASKGLVQKGEFESFVAQAALSDLSKVEA